MTMLMTNNKKRQIFINNDPLTASTDLVHMKNWFTKWRFKVNQSKYIHTTFILRQVPCPNVYLFGFIIPCSPTVKYLGLTLDQRLIHHIRAKTLVLNNRLRVLKIVLCNNKYISKGIKLLMYKSLLKPIWKQGLKLWGSAKKSNINKIQAFKNIALRKLKNAPTYVSNFSLHSNIKLKTKSDESKCYYKRFHNHLSTHLKLLIKNLAFAAIPTNPPRRIKRKWCRYFL